MAGGQAEEGVDSTTADPDERRPAEEVHQSQVHRYESHTGILIETLLLLKSSSCDRVHRRPAALLHQLFGHGSDLWTERSAQNR